MARKIDSMTGPGALQARWFVTLGAATWVAAMASGQLIVLATGVPASSAALNGFVVPFLLVFGVEAIPAARWRMTIAFGVYGVLAIPTVLLGPPGPHKILVALAAGILTDMVLHGMRRFSPYFRNAVAFALWGALLALLARVFYALLPLPGKEKFLDAFVALTIVFVVLSVIGSAVGTFVFRKSRLADNPLVRRINGGSESISGGED
jgi:hypothetical protein